MREYSPPIEDPGLIADLDENSRRLGDGSNNAQGLNRLVKSEHPEKHTLRSAAEARIGDLPVRRLA
jgi:hypothetical protein